MKKDETTMNSSHRRRYVQVLAHVLGWSLFVFMIQALGPSWNNNRFSEPFLYRSMLHITLLMSFFYLNSLWLIPQYLFKKKTLTYALLVVISIVVLVALNEWLKDVLGIDEMIHKEWQQWRAVNRPKAPAFPAGPRRRPLFDGFVLISALVAWGVSTSLTLIAKWYADAEQQQRLEKEKVSAELSSLKAQINPHFFFNTLNNIYSLIALDQGKAQESVHKLSRMMRYVLYDSQSGTTLLSQEIAFLKDYVELMQLRLKKNVQVTFDYPDDIQDLPVASMLLLPFVENAFKHGINYTQPSFVELKLMQQGHEITFKTRNRIFPKNSQTLEESNGIGLVNTRRRLDLLYPNQYDLKTIENQQVGEYFVELKLTLAQ